MLWDYFVYSQIGESLNLRKKTRRFIISEQCSKVPLSSKFSKKFPKPEYDSSVSTITTKSEKI